MEPVASLIDNLHMEDLKNRVHPSIFDENEGYNMFILRIPMITENEVHIRQMGFVLTAQNSYAYNRDNDTFEVLADRFDALHKMIDLPLDRLLKRFDHFHDQVADMEEGLYSKSVRKDFLTKWLRLKRDILQIERILMRSSLAIDAFVDFYEADSSFPVNHYMDIHEHIGRVLRSATFNLAKLDYIHNFYNVQTNEKMNSMIYLLTVISAIFLPLNLAVGFFGMNTSGLPFTGGDSGTLYAFEMMVLFLVIAVGFFGAIKWLQQRRNA